MAHTEIWERINVRRRADGVLDHRMALGAKPEDLMRMVEDMRTNS